jgi:hypothetical protein
MYSGAVILLPVKNTLKAGTKNYSVHFKSFRLNGHCVLSCDPATSKVGSKLLSFPLFAGLLLGKRALYWQFLTSSSPRLGVVSSGPSAREHMISVKATTKKTSPPK